MWKTYFNFHHIGKYSLSPSICRFQGSGMVITIARNQNVFKKYLLQLNTFQTLIQWNVNSPILLIQKQTLQPICFHQIQFHGHIRVQGLNHYKSVTWPAPDLTSGQNHDTWTNWQWLKTGLAMATTHNSKTHTMWHQNLAIWTNSSGTQLNSILTPIT